MGESPQSPFPASRTLERSCWIFYFQLSGSWEICSLPGFPEPSSFFPGGKFQFQGTAIQWTFYQDLLLSPTSWRSHHPSAQSQWKPSSQCINPWGTESHQLQFTATCKWGWDGDVGVLDCFCMSVYLSVSHIVKSTNIHGTLSIGLLF